MKVDYVIWTSSRNYRSGSDYVITISTLFKITKRCKWLIILKIVVNGEVILTIVISNCNIFQLWIRIIKNSKNNTTSGKLVVTTTITTRAKHNTRPPHNIIIRSSQHSFFFRIYQHTGPTASTAQRKLLTTTSVIENTGGIVSLCRSQPGPVLRWRSVCGKKFVNG